MTKKFRVLCIGLCAIFFTACANKGDDGYMAYVYGRVIDANKAAITVQFDEVFYRDGQVHKINLVHKYAVPDAPHEFPIGCLVYMAWALDEQYKDPTKIIIEMITDEKNGLSAYKLFKSKLNTPQANPN